MYWFKLLLNKIIITTCSKIVTELLIVACTQCILFQICDRWLSGWKIKEADSKIWVCDWSMKSLNSFSVYLVLYLSILWSVKWGLIDPVCPNTLLALSGFLLSIYSWWGWIPCHCWSSCLSGHQSSQTNSIMSDMVISMGAMFQGTEVTTYLTHKTCVHKEDGHAVDPAAASVTWMSCALTPVPGPTTEVTDRPLNQEWPYIQD